MSKNREQNKTCETCKYLKCGGADDNFRFACTCMHTARTYLTNYTPACENYEEDKEDEHAN